MMGDDVFYRQIFSSVDSSVANDDIPKEAMIWKAVILRAINDAVTINPNGYVLASEMHQARAWFQGNSPDFKEVCALAGVEAGDLRRVVMNLIKRAMYKAKEPVIWKK